MDQVIEEDVRCKQCGYNLRGLSVTSVCPECGTSQPRYRCRCCGERVSLPREDRFCLACREAIAAMDERRVLLNLVLPWRRGGDFRFWTAPVQARGGLFVGRMAVAAVLLVALGCVVCTAVIRIRFEREAHAPDGRPMWYWYGHVVYSHWTHLLPVEVFPGRGMRTNLFTHEPFRSRFVGLGVRPSARGLTVKELEYHVFVEHYWRRANWPHLLLRIAWPTMVFGVATVLIPPVTLMLFRHGGARRLTIWPGIRRLRCSIWAGLFAQGVLLVLLGMNDALSPLIGLPYLGGKTAGLEMCIPVLAHQWFVFRAIGFDRTERVFRARHAAQCVALISFVGLLLGLLWLGQETVQFG